MTVSTISSLAFVIISIARCQTAKSCGYYDTECIDLQPEDAYVLEGDTVRLTCTLYCNLTDTIGFGRVFRDQKVDSVDRGNVVQLTASSSELVLSDVSVFADDTVKFYCMSNELESECTSLRVFRRPLTPILHRCVVLHWQTMTCTWTPSGAFQIQHTNDYHVRTTVHSCRLQGNETSEHRCPSTSTVTVEDLNYNGEFVWNSPTLEDVYCMRVGVALNFARSTVLSNWTCLQPSLHVQPPPPTNVSHVLKNATHVVIGWRTRLPREVRDSLTYRITMTSDLQQEEPVVAEVIDTDTVIMSAIRPYTNHRVHIQVKPTNSGYWSESSVPCKFKSPPSVPCHRPQVAPHVFYPQDDTALIYWKSVPVMYQCGTNFSYLVVVLQPNSLGRPPHDNRVNLKETMISMSTRSLKPSSSVAVLSCTDQGCLAIDQRYQVNVTRIKQRYQTKVSAEGAGRTVTVYLLRTYTGGHLSLDSMTSFTVYWCLRGAIPHACADDIQWRQVPAQRPISSDEYSYSFSVPYELRRYQVGVAVNSESIQWASCIYTVNGSTFPPYDVTLTVAPPGLLHGRLQVKWSESECRQTTGRVTSYLIKYCVVDEDSKCTGDETARTERASQTAGTSYTVIIDDLNPNTLYGVRIFSYSAVSMSRGSTMVVARTLSGFIESGIVEAVITGLIVLVLLIAICSVRRFCRSWHRRQGDFAVTVPEARRHTATCDDQVDQDDQQHSSQICLVSFGDIWKTPRRESSGDQATSGMSSDSSYHDDQVTSLLSSTDTSSQHQFSDQSSRAFDSGSSEESSFTILPSIPSETVSYVKLDDAIGHRFEALPSSCYVQLSIAGLNGNDRR